MNVTDFPMLLVAKDPDEIRRVQEALVQANLVNPLRIVADERQAIAYLAGHEEYADRGAHPFPSLVLLSSAPADPTGPDLQSWIRSRADLRNLPLIPLASSAPSVPLGADPGLARPVDGEALFEKIRAVGMYWMILDRTLPKGDETLPSPRGRRVLVVDRDADFLRSIGEAMRRRTPSLAVDSVPDVEAALRRLASNSPEALVYERDIEGSEGFAFLDRIRAAAPHLPVVVLCAERDDAFAAEAVRRGATSVLLKQVRQDLFADRLHVLLTASMVPGPDGPRPSRASSAVVMNRTPAKAPTCGRRKETEVLGNQICFQKTSWELVRAAPRAEALDALIRLYWKPLYFFVRQRGIPNEEAKDIVQEFLTSALEHRMIPRADPDRGRFRTFLLAAMSNFLRDRRRSRGRLKRGGGRLPVSLDFEKGEPRYARADAKGEPPEAVIDRAWAKDLLGRCILELTGKPSHLLAFELQMQGADYESIGQATGLTVTAAKTAVHRLRVRLRGILRFHLRLQNATEEEVGREVAEFASLLA